MYAKGTHSVGICARCGGKSPLQSLISDGDIPGLLVHPTCRDITHPAEKPVRVEEGIAVKRPAPDLDDDSPAVSTDDLVTAMGWSAGEYFGGGT